MWLEDNLREMERCREAYWLRYPATSPTKLFWRAVAVRHAFHVLPGESILELGAGSGLWTRHLSSVLRGENPITAAVFNEEFACQDVPNVRFQTIRDLAHDLPRQSFDYIVGTGILCHDRYRENLSVLYGLLKPGGQILFFEANYWNPQVYLKNHLPGAHRWSGEASCQAGMRKRKLTAIAGHQGFANVEVIPYDIIHPRTPKRAVHLLQSLAFLFEHCPGVRDLCGTLYIWARKPGGESEPRPAANLAEHGQLCGAVSVVVPCHNEEMNVEPLVSALMRHYGPYIHEIVLVNDNSTDRTGQAAVALAAANPRVKVVNRPPPGGVGRALRDGYRAATGRYILTMDCDFVHIVPELRDLFDAVAAGYDGAIGSRFSHESILVNYPFLKILCNRGFHLLVNLFLPCRVRDISNNLKLYRADILKGLEIEQDHFAANVETGLKPVLAGHNIREVPISWVNREPGQGTSTFKIVKVAPGYFREFLAIARRVAG